MNIKKITEELGIFPSKKMGQNFLLHENTAKKILDWAEIPKDSNVVEIGPGLGALTFQLIERGYKIYAIEKDRKIHQYLSTQFPQNAYLVQADVLDFSFENVFPNEIFFLISNAPYSISSPILEKALSLIDRISTMVFLFQEEVVDRIGAKPGNKDYGRLSIWVQCQCDVERGPRISKENFFPKPDVESRLVKISRSKKPLVPKKDQEKFLTWIAKIFRQRRKTLRKNLKDAGYDSTAIHHAFEKNGVLVTARAEELSIPLLYALFAGLSLTLPEIKSI